MDKRQEKRLDLAVESVKQQITLATAIIGASLAFSGQLTEVRKGKVWDQLPIAFAPLAFSIVCGVFVLMSISFYLGTEEADPLQQSLVRKLGMAQNAAFILSVLLMVLVIALA